MDRPDYVFRLYDNSFEDLDETDEYLFMGSLTTLWYTLMLFRYIELKPSSP